MREQLPPGPALDERVCRALEPEPPTLPEPNDAGYVDNTVSPLGFWSTTNYPDDYCPAKWMPYAISTDGNVMLRAIEAMRERGWDSPGCVKKEGRWYCCFRDGRSGPPGETMPHCVALAILAALESEASE